MSDDSDDSDEWGMEELILPPKDALQTNEDDAAIPADGGDEFWAVEPKADPAPKDKEEKPKETPKGEPMIIVDITQIDANIHSKFDRNSVNDATAASELRKKIESNYEQYVRNSSLIADGTVVPCGSTVWRPALIRLRDDRPGHYFVPIFPPKQK